MNPMRQKLLLPVGCLFCLAVCWKSFWMFDGTEFGLGLLSSDKDLGGLLFLVAAIFTFKYPRIAAVSALAASVVSLPLYLYLVFPLPFRQVWPGQWEVLELPRESFIWDGWWITGIVSIVFVAFLSGRTLIRSRTSTT